MRAPPARCRRCHDDRRAGGEHKAPVRPGRSGTGDGRNTATIVSCPNSAPLLKPASDNAAIPPASPGPAKAPAKPKPCCNPNANAATSDRARQSGRHYSVRRAPPSAIADSTQREGSETSPSAASVNVIECATVNAVTILATSQNDPLKSAAACHLPSCVRGRPATATTTGTGCGRNPARYATRPREQTP